MRVPTKSAVLIIGVCVVMLLTIGLLGDKLPRLPISTQRATMVAAASVYIAFWVAMRRSR